MRKSLLVFYGQSAFIGGMLGFCGIKWSDWRFLVMVFGIIISTEIYGILVSKERTNKMKFFHFHDWTKWEEYDREVSEYTPPFGNFGTPKKLNWYGYTTSWTEKWMKRECKLCGEKKIKFLSHGYESKVINFQKKNRGI